MHGRRIYHARGKVLGGSSSINGMIFQRGNPLDFERWAADRGMEHVGLRALPAVLQAHGDVPRRRRTSGVAATARSCSSAARRRTRSSTRSSEAVQAGRLPDHRRTSTATGRRGSRSSTATSGAAAGSALPAPISTRCSDGRIWRCAAGCRSRRVLFDGTRAVGVETRGGRAYRRGRGDPLRWRDQLPAGARSSQGSVTPERCDAAGVEPVHVAAGCGREPAGSPRGLHPARLHATRDDAARSPEVACALDRLASGCSCARGPERRTISRPAASSARTTRSPIRT